MKLLNWKPWLAGADVHGDMQDDAACRAFFKFQDIWKPKIRICYGDIWDFRCLRARASDEEKRVSLAKDYILGNEWLKRFKPTHTILGNHDKRLWDVAFGQRGFASDSAALKIIEIEALLKQLGSQDAIPYHKRNILRIGDLKIHHGIYCGVTAARRMAQTYGACIFGHIHANQVASVEGLDYRAAVSAGCLCQLDQGYNAITPSSLTHCHGFAYGIINEKTGEYRCWTAQPVNGEWIIPSDMVKL
jgi:hypothetical protein